ncbi:MAG TPA: hypothetical protein VFE17_04225 [Candidatus Baltobacteraceae bacterium]|nr:hypothetical protein [Candidatus Baltobacteraceae bacterium]
MTHVYERVPLHCPYVQAREYIREILEQAVREGTLQPLALAAPIGRLDLPKRVLVRYARAEDPIHFDERWRVEWVPESGGPYPDFRGELRLNADSTRAGAVLELQGDFIPPSGAISRVFDMTIGARIAVATARSLLRHIGAQVRMRADRDRAAAEHR